MKHFCVTDSILKHLLLHHNQDKAAYSKVPAAYNIKYRPTNIYNIKQYYY